MPDADGQGLAMESLGLGELALISQIDGQVAELGTQRFSVSAGELGIQLSQIAKDCRPASSASELRPRSLISLPSKV